MPRDPSYPGVGIRPSQAGGIGLDFCCPEEGSWGWWSNCLGCSSFMWWLGSLREGMGGWVVRGQGGTRYGVLRGWKEESCGKSWNISSQGWWSHDVTAIELTTAWGSGQGSNETSWALLWQMYRHRCPCLTLNQSGSPSWGTCLILNHYRKSFHWWEHSMISYIKDGSGRYSVLLISLFHKESKEIGRSHRISHFPFWQ